MKAVEYARKNKIPCFGICYGMQLAVLEYAMNKAGFKKSSTAEIEANTTGSKGLVLRTEFLEKG